MLVFTYDALFDIVEGFSVGRTGREKSWLPKVAEAALSGDQKKLEIVLVRAIRSLKSDSPDVCQQLGQLLSEHSTNPNGMRWRGSGPPPVDAEEGFALVRAESVDDAPAPVLPASVLRRVDQFVGQRKNCQRLLEEGFLPPGSVLLTGGPGTGKTMLTRWIARELGLPFVTLDLSTSISSLLGKTGFNLRRTLDYARSRPCVLLLDEFDAIAKRRDDASEVGELKRIVNVLLKELEDWPLQSVLIAATNHPELLDRAIARRFDVVLDIPLPGDDERFEILRQSGRRFSDEFPAEFLHAVACSLEGASGSELDSLMSAAVRHHLATEQILVRSLIEEIQLRLSERLTSKNIGEFIRLIQSKAKGVFKVRELAELLDKSPSTIQHHLNKDVQHG
ncbi:AAA family ATPase [Gimesia sp.]|uniref:AAA family ATPase n=1 Tax=Gimesia sp. TaxID=2024833 RepID=UPI003A95197E